MRHADNFIFFPPSPRNPIQLHFLPQRRARNVQGARGFGFVAIVLRQHHLNVALFHFLEREIGRRRIAVVRARRRENRTGALLAAQLERQMLGQQITALAENHGAFDDILQLAHVAGPTVFQEHLALVFWKLIRSTGYIKRVFEKYKNETDRSLKVIEL